MQQKNHRSISLLLFWKCYLLMCLPLWTLPTFLSNKKNVWKIKKTLQNVKKHFLHLWCVVRTSSLLSASSVATNTDPRLVWTVLTTSVTDISSYPDVFLPVRHPTKLQTADRTLRKLPCFSICRDVANEHDFFRDHLQRANCLLSCDSLTVSDTE